MGSLIVIAGCAAGLAGALSGSPSAMAITAAATTGAGFAVRALGRAWREGG